MGTDVLKNARSVKANFYEILEQDKPPQSMIIKLLENVKSVIQLCTIQLSTLDKIFPNTSLTDPLIKPKKLIFV